eukprot:7843897-Pyramimonas_sp.AAC.1
MGTCAGALFPSWCGQALRASPRGHEALHWVGETHVDTATGALGGAPLGATKRRAGWGRHMWTSPLGP